MPHVIVAGATGAGKSVGLNVMLSSLLFRRTPEELRLLMIDPKVVELAPFDGIPHMLLPGRHRHEAGGDRAAAGRSTRWSGATSCSPTPARRTSAPTTAGSKRVARRRDARARARQGRRRSRADGAEVSVPAAKRRPRRRQLCPSKLPYIVIVVDEFADLMMQQGKDVEACVARLAQKARAAGMHVILATQRPSVDVITGMIKANFPTRIAFRVAQKVDSRTILDEQGAEHLLGTRRHADQAERLERHAPRAVPVRQRGRGAAR